MKGFINNNFGALTLVLCTLTLINLILSITGMYSKEVYIIIWAMIILSMPILLIIALQD